MATNPFLAQLMQQIAPQMQRMPQIGQQWAGMRPPMQGMFGQMPQRQFQPRRANFGGGMMPQIDIAQLLQALRGNPAFAPRAQAAPPPMTSLPPGAFNPAMPASPTNNPFAGYVAGTPMTPAQIKNNSGAGIYFDQP